MWAFSLSSGTSGGVLAPLLMIGAAIGETLARLAHMPGEAQALWALLGMGQCSPARWACRSRQFFFSLELTHALPALLPLALACTSAYLVTSLVMPRSILTEKLSRRGYHLSREYGVDPLEMVSVSEVMTAVSDMGVVGEENRRLPEILAYSDETCRAIAEEMATTGVMSMPVVDGRLGEFAGRSAHRSC